MVANGRRRPLTPAADGRLDDVMTASATTSRRDNRHARTLGGPGCGPAGVRGDSAAPERRRTMSRNAIRAVSVLVLALAASWNPTPAGAGTTGKLAGRVT